MKCEHNYQSLSFPNSECFARATRLVVTQEPDQEHATSRLACWAHAAAATSETGASIVLPVTRA